MFLRGGIVGIGFVCTLVLWANVHRRRMKEERLEMEILEDWNWAQEPAVLTWENMICSKGGARM